MLPEERNEERLFFSGQIALEVCPHIMLYPLTLFVNLLKDGLGDKREPSLQLHFLLITRGYSVFSMVTLPLHALRYILFKIEIIRVMIELSYFLKITCKIEVKQLLHEPLRIRLSQHFQSHNISSNEAHSFFHSILLLKVSSSS